MNSAKSTWIPHFAWIVLFFLCVVALMVPFLSVPHPPLLDYPNHLARTFVLHHLHDPAYQFEKAYEADWKPFPYILWDIIVVNLQTFLPVETAGKVVMMFAAAFMPLMVAWFLWQANRTEMLLSVLACAFTLHNMFLWGFLPYQLGLAACFLMVGTWIWYRREPSLLRAILFLLASFLAYFFHLLGFASAAFILVIYVVVTERNWKSLLRISLFLLPHCLLFLWAKPGLANDQEVFHRTFYMKLVRLEDVEVHGYNPLLDKIFIAGLILCVLLAVVRNKEFGVNRKWLWVSGALLLVYMALPYSWGDTFDIDLRLVPPLWILMLASFRVGKRARYIAIVGALLVFVRVVNVSEGFRAQRPLTDSMDRAISMIDRDSRILPMIDNCDEGDPIYNYWVHYWAYSVIRQGAMSPYLFDIPGQTPMRVYDEMYTPDGYWDHCYDTQPQWDKVADEYDYIWAYGSTRWEPGMRTVADLVYRDKLLRLYKIRK